MPIEVYGLDTLPGNGGDALENAMHDAMNNGGGWFGAPKGSRVKRAFMMAASSRNEIGKWMLMRKRTKEGTRVIVRPA